MLVHLGHNRAVQDRDILLMADLNTAKGVPPWGLSPDTTRLLERLEEKGRLEKLGDRPQSLILWLKKDGSTAGILTTTGMRSLRLRLNGTGYDPSDNILKHAASSDRP